MELMVEHLQIFWRIRETLIEEAENEARATVDCFLICLGIEEGCKDCGSKQLCNHVSRDAKRLVEEENEKIEKQEQEIKEILTKKEE